MMLQAASRQSQHQHQHQHQLLSGSGPRPHTHQNQHRLPLAPKSAAGYAAYADYDEDSNLRSGRFASALLFMAVLVLMVDASRIILYSWYTDGSYLKYLYGSDSEIRWPKCSGGVGGGDGGGVLPDQPPTTASTSSSAAVIITAVSQRSGSRGGQPPQQQEQQLDQFKDTLMGGLTIAGQLLDAAVGGEATSRPLRRVPKHLVRVLFHASTVACLFFLAVAIFPAALRTHRSCCLLVCSLVFSLVTVLVAGASATASLMSVYFFSACELQPRLSHVYDFVPGCDALRRAFLGAECFSLIVVCSSVCILLHLQAYFCRALGVVCGCCRGGDAGDPEFNGNNNNYDTSDQGAGGQEFELARTGRRQRSAYEEDEYLA